MATNQLRETVVIVDGSGGASNNLRDGLAQRWLVLQPELDDSGSDASDRLTATLDALVSEQYGLIGVSAGASAALDQALRSPERVTALVLVAPLAVRPAGSDHTGGSPDLERRLGEVQCPTLVVFGQEDTRVAPEAASIYRSRIPNCNIAFVYGAGHDVAADRPQALLNLVADYLERRETFIVQSRSGAINP